MKPQQPVRRGANAGANSSKVEIPWKIRRGIEMKSPFLSRKKGLFLWPKGEVGRIDIGSGLDDMGGGRKKDFHRQKNKREYE